MNFSFLMCTDKDVKRDVKDKIPLADLAVWKLSALVTQRKRDC